MTESLYRQSFLPGAVVFREGEGGDCAYVIEDGRVEISALRDGRHVVLARLDKGELFGEMALIDGSVRSATATAIDSATLVVIRRGQVEEKLRGADPIINLFLRVIMDRLRTTNALLASHDQQYDSAAQPQHQGDYDQMRDRAIDQIKLEQELEQALAENHFELWYQPIVETSRQQVAGFEALVRWRHPERGIVPPGQFINLAEQTGLIVPIGSWVIEEACAALKHLAESVSGPQQEDSRPLFMGINLSARQLTHGELLDTLHRGIDRAGIDPADLKLEVTESLLMESPDVAVVVLNQLKQLGVELAVDDFGTGYSSLSYLHRFPIDVLKVDRSFVSSMLDDSASLKIVRSVTKLAKELGLRVVAEGVERREELTVLADLGCEYVQGYLFSPPVGRGKAEQFLTAPQPWQQR